MQLQSWVRLKGAKVMLVCNRLLKLTKDASHIMRSVLICVIVLVWFECLLVSGTTLNMLSVHCFETYVSCVVK